MSFSFGTALSGLRANSNALGVTGNNIANANTIGFRSGSITFADVFADSRGIRFNGAGTSMQVGNGVRVAAIHSNFSQGSLTETGASTNAAIQGNGFFVVRNANGEQHYTRAGDFVLNNNGNLVMPNGEIVQGYQAVNGVIPSGASVTDIQIPIGQTIPPTVTSEAMVRMNLDSTAATGAEFHATMRVYDSRGTARTLDMTFTRLANGSYDMNATLDGVAAQSNGGATVNFTFDANGNPTAPATLQIVPDQTALGGAALPSIDIELRQTNPDGTPGPFNITNYANPSAISATDQNGSAAGEFSGLASDNNGLLYAVFSNRQSRVIGQYALATFTSQEGLNRLGDNLFGETITSGQAAIGAPGSGGRGLVIGSALEQSNVDIATEFVNLIEAQRGFQSNSRVITTMNQALQELIQII
jgi:flagellar hook protein FlgE